MFTCSRGAVRTLLSLTLIAGLTTAAAVAPASAAPTVVASALTSGADVNLTSFTSTAPPFSNAGDGFEVFQRGVSDSIPFSVLDDSLTLFPGDSLGIIDENNSAPFFGITDTENGDNAGPVTASLVFDVSGATDLTLSLDLGAMGDFEGTDTFVFTVALDGAAPTTVLDLVVDEAGSRTYTMAGGAPFTLDDPLNAGAVELSNVLQTITAPIAGSGNQLTVSVTAATDGGSEAVVFQNVVIMGETDGGPTGLNPGDLVITEVMQNPSAVGDSSGEWFEIHNPTGADIDIDGFAVRDDDSDSFVIASGGPLVVPAGGYLVLGNNASFGTNGGVAVDYEYSGLFLSNSADELVLVADGVEIDRIAYDGGAVWPDPNGASMNLDSETLDANSNNDGANWCEASSTFGLGDRGTPGAANNTCVPPEPETIFIHDIQGDGPTAAITGLVRIQGITTSLFTRDDVLDGFFVQEEDADADADPATSEGIFVFCRNDCPSVAVGDLITVDGQATEFFDMTQIDAAFGSGTFTIESSGNPLPTAAEVDLPASGDTEAPETFESTEGMIVSFSDTLAVSEYFELARYGQVVLTENERPYQFTHLNLPSVAGYDAFVADLATRRIILDDDNNDQNDPIFDGPEEAYFYPEPGLSTGNRFRGGDTITDLTGVLHWSFAGQSGTDAWRVRPIDGVEYSFESANPATAVPDDVGGDISVASFNVLNYFTTLNTGASICGPSANQGCRGANSSAELDRQRAKIVAAIVAMDADVVGLIELENDTDDASIADLVAGLNAATAPGTYDFVATGAIGDDAIKVGLVYQPATVAPVDDFAILDSSIDSRFMDTKNRPVLIQTFQRNDSEGVLTVAANHLKSKGSSCDDVGDPGLGDGQANCAGTRTAAADALAGYLATDPTGSGDPDFLIIGDLNSYAMEDPIQALEAAGYVDLLNTLIGPDAYSYLFDGQLGYLDYAMSNGSLTPSITGITSWHINADEVPLFDYNDDLRDSGERSFERESGALELFAPDPLRSSDHDPVLVGIDVPIPANPTCQGLPATIIGTPGDDTLLGTNGPDVIIAFGGDDTILAGNGDDVICAGYGDDVIEGGNGVDSIDAGFGDDVIDAGRGDDSILAGAGNDTLVGDRGDDTLDGEAGIDEIDGGLGSDTCTNGEDVLACEFG